LWRLLGLKARLLILLAVIAFFVWASYWLWESIEATAQLIGERSFFIEQTKIGWWTAVFYATEVTPSLGIAFRWIAALLALYSASIFVRSNVGFTSKAGKAIRAALLFEGLNYLTMIPVVISGFTFPFSGELWYYGATPGIVVLLLNGVATLATVVIVPFFVFKLRSKIVLGTPDQEIVKWACLTGAAYLFVFWFVYTISWMASLVPWSARAQPGLRLLLNPLDLASFTLTVFFLLIVVLYGWTVLISSAKRQIPPSPRSIGIILTSLGMYFMLTLIIFLLYGGYHAHPTVWMEILGPYHNPDLWCIGLIPAGLYFATSKH